MSLVALHRPGPSPSTLRDAPLPHPSSLPGEVLPRKPAYSVPNLLGKVFITPHTFKTCLLPYKRKFKPQSLLLLSLRSWEGESNQISFSFPLQKSKLPFAYPYGYFASQAEGHGHDWQLLRLSHTVLCRDAETCTLYLHSAGFITIPCLLALCLHESQWGFCSQVKDFICNDKNFLKAFPGLRPCVSEFLCPWFLSQPIHIFGLVSEHWLLVGVFLLTGLVWLQKLK